MRLQRITGVLVSIVIIAACFSVTVPVSASVPGDVQWTLQDIPSTTKNVILNGSQIIDIAAGSDGKTIYVANIAGDQLYKSTDAGQSFESISNNYGSAGGQRPVALSVAPDDVNTVAVTDGKNVIITKDGGTTWSALPIPAISQPANITDVVVAPARSGTLFGREYFIAIANPGGDVGGGFGDLQVIGADASWATVGGGLVDGVPGPNMIAGVFDFTSVVVSPNFLGDRCVVAVGTKAAAGSTALLIINTATHTVLVGSGTPVVGVPLLSTGSTSKFQSGQTGILSSSVGLPSNFDPTSSSGRRTYVAIASVGSQPDNDVYRVDDNTSKALGAVTASPIKSIAYSGTTDSGILFMGPKNNTDIKYTTKMTSSSPDWTTTLKGPVSAGAAPSVVITAANDYATSKRIFAGTVGAESALNISNDGGISFNAESLIDTGAASIGSMRGVTFTTDARMAFINTRDSRNYISIWRSELPLTGTSWSRILSKALVNVGPGTGCSLKLNPVPIPPLSLFFAETSTVNGPIYVSSDNGVSFATRNGPSGAGLKTLSVRDGQTLYYVDASANVYKSTNAGWTWGTGVSTGVLGTSTQGYRIILPRANTLIIGGATVAISTDDAATFTLMNNSLPAAVPNIPFPNPGTGYILSTDTRFAENSIIYATDTGLSGAYNIYRIKADNTANTWENLGVTVTAPAGARIAEMTVRTGILYAMTDQASQGALRTLYPTDLIGNQNWRALSAGLPFGMANIGAAPGIVLYASDALGTVLYAFNDYLAVTKPTLTSPDDNYNDGVDPNTGKGYAADLKMKPMGTGTGQVDKVDVEIVDKNNGFTGNPTPGFTGVTVAATNPVVNTTGFALQPNHVYQWRMRAAHATSGQTIDSPWSESRTISVQAGSMVSQQYAGPVLLGPPGGAQNLDPNAVGITWAPVPGATEYQVIVAEDAALTKPVAGTPAKVTVPAYQATGLQSGKTYFFGVKVTQPTESIQTISTFTTAPRVAAPAGGGIAPTTPPVTVIAPAPPAQGTPVYAWAVIIFGIIMVIVVIILIMRSGKGK